VRTLALISAAVAVTVLAPFVGLWLSVALMLWIRLTWRRAA